MKILQGALVAITLSSALSAASINYRALPGINLNESAGANRSNISFAESDLGFMNGDDFTLAAGFIYRINSITVYSVASNLNDPLGNEFSSVALWGRTPGEALLQLAAGAPDTTFSGTLVANSNPDIQHELIQYANAEDYEAVGFAGAFFPLWATTFSNLNWTIYGGTLYEYAVQGVGTAPDAQSFYGYWFNHGSNALLSGSFQNQADGRFRVFNVTDPTAASGLTNPESAGLWDKTADLNIVMDVDVVNRIPEPGTWALMSLGLAGLALAGRRRIKQ
ncbi:MAG: PEP-CTERM sorting domain-containing protein [Bryobacteraceae bacterium]